MDEEDSKILPKSGLRKKMPRISRLRTQRSRAKAIENLEKLAEIAHRYAISDETNLNCRRDWARLETYVLQTVNNITQSYDEVSIETRLKALKKMVDDEMGARNQPDKKKSGKKETAEDRPA